MSDKTENLRMILKFDTGADGFKKMIVVLAAGAVFVLLSGIYFLLFVYKDMLPS